MAGRGDTLSDFTFTGEDGTTGPIDPTTVVGVMLYTNDYEVSTDESGNPLNSEGSPVAEGEPATCMRSPHARRFTSASSTSLAHPTPRGLRLVPAHAQADVVAVYSDDYTTGDVNMAGSLTQATYAPETVGDGTVAKYTDVQGIEISLNNPVVLPTTADQTPKLHFDIWRSPTDQDADLMIALTDGLPFVGSTVYRHDFRRQYPRKPVGHGGGAGHGRPDIQRGPGDDDPDGARKRG